MESFGRGTPTGGSWALGSSRPLDPQRTPEQCFRKPCSKPNPAISLHLVNRERHARESQMAVG